MSFGLSIGDICSQITYRLFTAATSGRKDAPRRLRELDDILLGLNCALNCLQNASLTVLPTSNGDASNYHRQIGLMLRSCRRTLEELENATAKCREAGQSPTVIRDSKNGLKLFPQEFIAHVKVQWRRFIWDLQEDSFSQYRHRIQSHTNSINLLLSTLIWFVSRHGLDVRPAKSDKPHRSATDRIEKDGRRQGKMMQRLLHQAFCLNSALFSPVPNQYGLAKSHRSLTFPDISPSNAMSSPLVKKVDFNTESQCAF
ncbi:hypothetical protein N7508_005872 [Penicillium antarcticum]|uniref:uncharacterized protein n=1 Tax=Penicillium antarcticum TaxID=416450 RepID=UPI00239870A7|nr:uncharacterized protein N7508_005872 [Penicillium antarcticum]KAJ5306857.1 hypothetical protein N7508_005872 [Penicillium antarcticum]